MTKVCSKCNLEKDESEFGKSKRSKDGLNYICKACKRAIDNNFTANNREKRNSASKEWRKQNPDKVADQFKKRKEYLLSLKQPCVKCGESRPWVIEFHHIDPTTKLFNLAYAISNGSKDKKAVEAELKKCVFLCANCHAEFHYLFGTQPIDPIESLDKYLKDL